MTSNDEAPPAPKNRFIEWVHRFEDAFSLLILGLMAFLPVLEALFRLLGSFSEGLRFNVPGAIQIVSALTMWIGFAGAMLATRQDQHLSLSTGSTFLKGIARHVAVGLSLLVAVVVTAILAYGAWLAVEAEQISTATLPGGIPTWVAQLIMPIGYAVIAVRLVLVKAKSLVGRIATVAAAAAVIMILRSFDIEEMESTDVLMWAGLAAILAATALGAPIYVALGGAALLLFWVDDEPIAAVAAETVRQIKNPTMPTIPLFTFTGFILAEAKTSERLVRFFRALVGWMPGGMALMTALVCAFFTTFTGASGVTILALGALLFPVLQRDKYPEEFSIGLLTASGSIGLLFPPSLPIILFGVTANVRVDHMFAAGVLPGFVLVGAVSLLGMRAGLKAGAPRPPLDVKALLAAANEAKWELALPVIVVGGIFTGVTTLVEAAAFTAAYAVIVEVFIYRDLSLVKDMPRVARDCSALVGAVLIILGVAMGFTSYLVDAEVPEAALEWVKGDIESKWVFLLALNLFLLVVGCLMDIFSAIVVVVPLILPIGEHFGVHPIHLGIIFLANLELGFLTPPVGMNLFLSSVRFKKPLIRVYGYAVPFLAILAVAVLLITYLPALTLAPVEWIFGEVPETSPIRF